LKLNNKNKYFLGNLEKPFIFLVEGFCVEIIVDKIKVCRSNKLCF